MHNPKCLLCNVKKPKGKLEQWQIQPYGNSTTVIGQVYGATQWKDGSVIYTSEVVKLDEVEGHLQTRNSLYVLGEKRRTCKTKDCPNLYGHDALSRDTELCSKCQEKNIAKVFKK